MPYKDPIIRAEKALERNKKFRERHPQYYTNYDKVHGAKYTTPRRLTHVKNTYGLDAEEYLQMILDQSNVCAICHNPEKWKNKHGDVRPLSVDHDHVSGKVRALLCTSCNALLGHAKDNIDILLSAADYLDQYKEEI